MIIRIYFVEKLFSLAICLPNSNIHGVSFIKTYPPCSQHKPWVELEDVPMMVFIT